MAGRPIGAAHPSTRLASCHPVPRSDPPLRTPPPLQVPGARYVYRVASSDDQFGFQAAPQPNPDASFTFLAFGDMGESVHAAAKSPG